MSYTPTEWESTDVVTATRMNALEQAVGDMNMSYTPNTWSDGDILSADKMNALEQAVASGGGGSSDHFICTVDAETDALDKTWQEITDALGDNKTVIAILNTYAWVVAGTSSDPEFGAYYVAVFNNGQATDFFYAESADDYPVLD